MQNLLSGPLKIINSILGIPVSHPNWCLVPTDEEIEAENGKRLGDKG